MNLMNQQSTVATAIKIHKVSLITICTQGCTVFVVFMYYLMSSDSEKLKGTIY